MITSNDHSPTLLEGFPLYWVPKVEFKKPRGLDAMAPYERELCDLLPSLGAKFGSSTLIKHEFEAEMLKKYIGLHSPLPFNLPYLHTLTPSLHATTELISLIHSFAPCLLSWLLCVLTLCHV